MWEHIYFGEAGCRRNYAGQYRVAAPASMGVPVVIGETGVPFDARPGDPAAMLDIMTDAMEKHKFGWTLWNYTPENKGAGAGDLWNSEDFSLVTHGDKLRATDGWVKPYMIRCAGRIRRSGTNGSRYEVDFDGVGGTSELFVPNTRRLVVEVDGTLSTTIEVEGVVELELPAGRTRLTLQAPHADQKTSLTSLWWILLIAIGAVIYAAYPSASTSTSAPG